MPDQNKKEIQEVRMFQVLYRSDKIWMNALVESEEAARGIIKGLQRDSFE
jgi:hypothetical protein